MKSTFISILALLATSITFSQELQVYSDYKSSGQLYGYKNAMDAIIIPAKYHSAKSFKNGLALVAILDKDANWKHGFINEKGKEVIPLKYSSSHEYFSEDLVAVELNEKWGFINREAKVMIPFSYDFIYYTGFTEGLAPVMLNKKWGYIDKNGKQVVPFIYEQCKDFSEGLAAVKQNGRWGFIDINGKLVIPLNYSEVSNFSGGMGGVEFNNKWAVTNKSGKLLTSFIYDDVHFNYNKGAELKEVSTFNGSHKYGAVNKQGKETIPLTYYTLNIYHGEIATAQVTNGVYGLINGRNKILLPFKYKGIYLDMNQVPQGSLYETADKRRIFSIEGDKVNIWKYEDVQEEYSGRRAVRFMGKWGFIDEQGKEAVPLVYDTVERFYNDVAMVMRNKKVGFVNKTGKEVIPAKYDGIYWKGLHEGLIAVVNDNKYGFVDAKGNEVIALKYDAADDFSEGLAAVMLNKKIGFIDTSGKLVINCQYEHLQHGFYQGKATVTLNGKTFFIDKTGKEIR